MSEVVNVCPKCNAKGFLKLERGNTHTALVCGNCNSWIKWVGKAKIPLYEKMISEQGNVNNDKLVKFENNLKVAINSLGLSKCEIMQIIEKVYA